MVSMLEDIFSDAPRLGQLVEKNEFIDSSLRGASQVVFTNNPISGLIIIIALFLQSVHVGTGALVGIMSNTLFAYLFGINKPAIRAGLHGYNGTLVGAALATFCTEYVIYVVIVFISFIAFMLHIAMANALGLPVLTMPFNLSALIFLFGALQYNWFPLPFAGYFIDPALVNDIEYSPLDVFLAIPKGIGQVYLCDYWVSGVLILVGILIGSRIAAVFAIVGSSTGVAMAYLLGASYNEMIAGLWGYNPVLGAMAVGGYFFYLNWRTAILAVCCACTNCFVFGMVKSIFAAWGVPSCTLGFCLGTFIFLFQKSSHKFFQPIPLALVTTHDKNFKLRPANDEVEMISHEGDIENLLNKIEDLTKKYDRLRRDVSSLRPVNVNNEELMLNKQIVIYKMLKCP